MKEHQLYHHQAEQPPTVCHEMHNFHLAADKPIGVEPEQKEKTMQSTTCTNRTVQNKIQYMITTKPFYKNQVYNIRWSKIKLIPDS